VDTYSATVYAGKAIDAGEGRKLNVMVGSAYSWHDIDSRWQIAAGGALNDTAKANYKASTTQVFGEVGYAIPMEPSSTLEPFSGVGYSDLRTRGFTESGSVAALSGQSQNAQTTSTTLGLCGATRRWS
jgi:subtilase-type serine protease